MKKILALCTIASLAFMIGCGNAGDRYINKLEKFVVKYEKIMASGDYTENTVAELYSEAAELGDPPADLSMKQSMRIMELSMRMMGE